jgi:hypothetical protein
MRNRAVGCLPLFAGGLLLGVVTRTDMLRAGVTQDELGGSCWGCGTQHALVPDRERESPTFCRECLECRGDSIELGGGD